MKKFFVGFLCVFFCFMLIACENETQLRVAKISDNTSAMSKDYSIRVVLEDDDRVKDKYVDVQIKANKDNQKLIFGSENQEKGELVCEKKDYWYNLTYLASRAKNEEEVEYKKYQDFGDKIYNFYTDRDCELKFRVICGKLKTNEQTGEEILVLSEDISEEFSLQVQKHDEK